MEEVMQLNEGVWKWLQPKGLRMVEQEQLSGICYWFNNTL
jgi:hypothetical protein